MILWIFVIARILFLVLERIVVKRLGNDSSPLAVGLLFFLFGTIVLLPFAILEERTSWGFLLFAIPMGLLLSVAEFFYIGSISRGELSTVVPLFNFNVVFIAILAAIFAAEALSLQKIIGIALLVLGAVKLQNKSLRIDLGNWPVKAMLIAALLIAALLFACFRSIDTVLFRENPIPPISYAMVAYGTATLVYLGLIARKGLINQTRELLEKRPIDSLLSGVANSGSYLALLFAIKGIAISVIEPIVLLNLPITLLVAQREFKEKPDWIAIGIMLLGAWAVFG